ncbi:extracellular solute-binding protein, partial [Robinsoniella sp.]
MTKRKRILCFVLGLSMAAGLLSGCGGKADSESASKSASESTAEGASKTNAEESTPMVLDLAIPWPEKYTEDQQVRKILEEKYNVKFEYHVSPGKEGVNLQIASGDTPDYMVEFNITDYWHLVDQGVLAEVPVELIKKHAPKYSEWLERESGMGESVWENFMKDGKNYAMFNLWTLATNCSVTAYRQDLLEQAGIAKAPETIDEMETAFKAIKEKLNIPAFGAGDGGESMLGFGHIFGAFGTYLCNYEEDGELKYGPIQPEAKQALEVLNRWYKAGYIDPEFIITKHEQMVEKFTNSELASAA